MPTPKATITFVADEDGAAILDIERGLLLELNVTGAYVWTHLQANIPVDAIITGLAAETEMPTSVVGPDVHRFLDLLKIEQMTED
jgi:hypothetical protein